MPPLPIKGGESRSARRGILAFAFIALLILGGRTFAQSENLPPKPAGYFTDQAGAIDAATGLAINEQLAQFERDTSNQILVAIYPNLPEDAEVAQYSIDTFNAWQPGQKGKDNGAVLFIYFKDHKMFICTGRGLEGALPDATCKEIVSRIITPAFRQGNYAGGVQAGVNAMIAATKGEYKGVGMTDQEAKGDGDNGGGLPPGVVIAIFIAIFLLSRFFGGGMGVPMIFSGGGWGGGGGFGGFGGGGGGGGFSGFSGGGGSSAGGGAGGSW
jgi:uncharacterized protein